MADDFPDDVRQFIGTNIASLAQLELLLFFHRERSRSWNVAEVSQKLSFTPSMTASLLSEFLSCGLVARNGESFQYRSIDSHTDELVGKLKEAYRVRRVAVTNEIYAKPLNRLKSFSDAFRFRRDE
jgi:hypothetical protein